MNGSIAFATLLSAVLILLTPLFTIWCVIDPPPRRPMPTEVKQVRGLIVIFTLFCIGYAAEAGLLWGHKPTTLDAVCAGVVAAYALAVLALALIQYYFNPDLKVPKFGLPDRYAKACFLLLQLALFGLGAVLTVSYFS